MSEITLREFEEWLKEGLSIKITEAIQTKEIIKKYKREKYIGNLHRNRKVNITNETVLWEYEITPAKPCILLNTDNGTFTMMYTKENNIVQDETFLTLEEAENSITKLLDILLEEQEDQGENK